MQRHIAMKFAGYAALILLCKRGKVRENIYYNSRYNEFFSGELFLLALPVQCWRSLGAAMSTGTKVSNKTNNCLTHAVTTHQNFQRHRAVSLQQHGFLVENSYGNTLV